MPIATPEVYAQMLDAAKAKSFAYPAINVSSSQTLNAALKGFADAGVFKAAGWKHDDWRDVVFMQRELGAGGQTPPDAPGLPLVDKKPAR